MLELLALDASTIIGGIVLVLVLGFLRFGESAVNLLLSYQSSPVEAVERSLLDGD